MVRLERITMQGFKSFAGKVGIPLPEGFNVVAGPNGSGKCLSFDTYITLVDGSNVKIGELVEEKLKQSKRIEKLEDGMATGEDGTKILTLNNKLKIEARPIKAFIKRTAPDKMLKVKTRSGREITTTPYHPFFGINENGIFSLEAKDLKIKRKIAVPRIIKTFEEPKPRKISSFKIPSLTPEIARFLGYMISEGRSTDTNQLWFVNDDEDLISDFVRICDTEFDLKANVFSYKGETKDVILFSKPLQVWLESMFSLGIGSKSSEKLVPSSILNSDENIVTNFLSALFEGDGYVHVNDHQLYFEYATASKELALGVQHLLLRLGVLSNIKEKHKCAANTKNKTKRLYYSVYAYGESLGTLSKKLNFRGRKRRALEKIISIKTSRNPNTDLISNINPIIKELAKECRVSIKKTRRTCPKLAAYYENRCECSRNGIKEVLDIIKRFGTVTERAQLLINQLNLLADSDIFWDEIIEIQEITPAEYVYDLTVDETHNYIANNFFVHNSNLIDALTFVLGTTSARSIRAQKLEALIFNGGKDHKPAEFCEVSIYFNNSDGKIPGEDKEIKITRRITRSGISVYKLNGRTVTRAKIVDVLSYAGLSPDGHNIIMQGDVTQLIEMNPKERRGILDDISGISEFDDKRQKAMTEMEKVETRVRENMIVVAEKQRLVARLKEEKEAAEKYKKLEEELKRSKSSVFFQKLHGSEEKMKILEKEIHDDTESFNKMEKEFEKSEKELEEKEKGVLKKSDVIVKKSKNYDIQRKIDLIQTDVIRKKDKIDLYDREISRLRSQSDNPAVREILALNNYGVHGKLIDLVKIPKKISVALSVAIGRHANDIVVDDEDIAAQCIKHLKEKKIGRARFIPLRVIKSREKKEYRGHERTIGYAIELVEFEKKFQKAFEYVLASTLVVDNIDTAKRIRGFRSVTLDGDLVETSGVMIGGFLAKKGQTDASGVYSHPSVSTKQIEDEINKLNSEIINSEMEVQKLKDTLEDEGQEIESLTKDMSEDEKLLDELRKKRKELYEQRLRAQGDIGKKRIEKAKLEATLENMRLEKKDYEGVSILKGSIEELEERARRCIIEINKLGPVNMKALDEYFSLNIEFEELKKKLDKLLEEKDAIMAVVKDVETRRYSKFTETMNFINSNFSKVYKDLTGGEGRLRLEEDNNIDSGLLIEASPPGKKILNMDSMSGGEKSMTSLAFLFAVLQYYQSPFYVLDEVDAALDKSNTKRIMTLVKKYSKEIQFIVISHNDTTIAEADKVFGVSMEDGISKVFGIELHRRDDGAVEQKTELSEPEEEAL